MGGGTSIGLSNDTSVHLCNLVSFVRSVKLFLVVVSYPSIHDISRKGSVTFFCSVFTINTYTRRSGGVGSEGGIKYKVHAFFLCTL